jgi:hypothetical protein
VSAVITVLIKDNDVLFVSIHQALRKLVQCWLMIVGKRNSVKHGAAYDLAQVFIQNLDGVLAQQLVDVFVSRILYDS